MERKKESFETVFTQQNYCEEIHVILDTKTGERYLWITTDHGMAVASMEERGERLPELEVYDHIF
ncbi:hypothetical protein [Cloacibacillus porcorum]